MRIEQRIYKILTENTGISIMDSGMGEGRHWQQNQKKTLKDFQNDPTVGYEIDQEGKTSGDITYTVSLFHYLTSVLSEDEVCKAFNRKACKEWNADYYGISKLQENYLLNTLELRPVGESFNSYNDESSLSQVIQGQYFSSDDTDYPDYVLLQIHNGADVRGGYTDAKLFKLEYGYIDSCPFVSGTIDGTEVETGYEGYTITDEQGNLVELGTNPQIKLSI